MLCFVFVFSYVVLGNGTPTQNVNRYRYWIGKSIVSLKMLFRYCFMIWNWLNCFLDTLKYRIFVFCNNHFARVIILLSIITIINFIANQAPRNIFIEDHKINLPFGGKSKSIAFCFFQNLPRTFITLFFFLSQLTLPMLRLLSSKTQGCKYLWKPSKPCHLGIHWIALAEHSQMSTHIPGFQSFSQGFCIILYWPN